MPATHARRSLKLQYCSVIKQTGGEQRLPIWVAKKYVTPAAHEALQRVSSTARPQKDTLALIEPRITPAAIGALQRVSSTARPQNDTLVLVEPRVASAHTLDGTPQHEIWQTWIVARTVTKLCSKTNSALVQIGNPSDRYITLKPNTIVGTISPVTAILPRTASAISCTTIRKAHKLG